MGFGWSCESDRSFLFGGPSGFNHESSSVQVRPNCRLAGFLSSSCYLVLEMLDPIGFKGPAWEEDKGWGVKTKSGYSDSDELKWNKLILFKFSCRLISPKFIDI